MQPLCLRSDIGRDRSTPSSCPVEAELVPSKLAVGLSCSIHHSCSTFSSGCLLFFTEIPPLNLLMPGLSPALSCYFVLFMSDPPHVYHSPPCSFFTSSSPKVSLSLSAHDSTSIFFYTKYCTCRFLHTDVLCPPTFPVSLCHINPTT